MLSEAGGDWATMSAGLLCAKKKGLHKAARGV